MVYSKAALVPNPVDVSALLSVVYSDTSRPQDRKGPKVTTTANPHTLRIRVT